MTEEEENALFYENARKGSIRLVCEFFTSLLQRESMLMTQGQASLAEAVQCLRQDVMTAAGHRLRQEGPGTYTVHVEQFAFGFERPARNLTVQAEGRADALGKALAAYDDPHAEATIIERGWWQL